MNAEANGKMEDTQMKHTPGPWRLDVRTGMVAVYPGEERNCLSGIEAAFVHSKHWPSIVEDGSFKGYDRNEQDIANAQLIAAAPDLLEALSEMMKLVADSHGLAGFHLNDDVATWSEFEEQVDAAEAAIAKAEGKVSDER